MPPPGSGVPALSLDERLAFVRWVDLGCPIDAGAATGNGGFGWFVDDNRPTLEVSLPRPGPNAGPLRTLRVGVADAYTGIAPGSLSIRASVAINGRPPDSELADLAQQVGAGIFEVDLSPALPPGTGARVRAAVRDAGGNVTRVERRFSVEPGADPGRTAVSGRVSNERGAPLTGIRVLLYRVSGKLWQLVARGRTDPAGNYRLEGLAAGSYFLQFRDPRGLYAGEWFDDAVRRRSAALVTVTDGAMATANAALGLAAVP
jgi:5-hydroxyisourate hydrolase-like protein (transthyretin family)